MDEYLLDVLLDQKNNGQKPDRNFSHATYDVAVKAMNERFTVRVNKDKVTNRLKTLKKKMDIGVEVFRRGRGFGWNDITKQIEAPPEWRFGDWRCWAVVTVKRDAGAGLSSRRRETLGLGCCDGEERLGDLAVVTARRGVAAGLL
ncbi:hypothetical protein RJ640_019312 [Escallonia rubra]|uniref:Myb/SANT-like domain-containing protein n=1 Tax=Escallonia rubra TaxID=112253 RepID=A0AA88UKW8_9ASTE|nr:hypothetical protein RJ640_019312 [Escallonia rubra]